MEHSKKFATVKKYYDTIKPNGARMWTAAMVANAVAKGWITEAEYKEIAGDKAVEPAAEPTEEEAAE